ncbi:conserved hypothetical protein [Catenulispora acidiphila DSM 44928]|uniref:DUF1062 domain-containing protein n=2 Tax=Catenulispora TaxID=414878 RepID=C7Q3S1_CATAD|nr:conserved hypothetical protein [Catenulispora acidiphila DSM 44928]
MRASTQWRVRPTTLPTIRRRCRSCPSMEFHTQGRFRVNANHKLLDVWLLALCAQCGETIKLTVLERAHVRSIDPAALDGFHENDASLAARLLTEPRLTQRNGIALDWADGWRLDMDPVDLPKADILDVSVEFTHHIPLRVTTVIATGLEMSGSEVAKHIASGVISSDDKLSGRRGRDFSFVVRW